MPTRVDDTRPAAVRRPVDTPLRVALVALVIALGFVGLRLAAHEGRPGSFIRLGHLTVTEELPGDLSKDVIQEIGSDYDGQYYYRLAREPFSTEEYVDGVPFDRPAYRNARIGYPFLAWIASAGGQESLVPWAMILVNVLAIAAVAGFTAALARDSGWSGWYGLAAAAWPGLLVGLSIDLAEPVEAAFLVAALLALRRQRWALAAAALTYAVLARETALLLAGALLIVGAVEWVRAVRSARPAGHAPHRCGVAVTTIGIYGAMQLIMSHRWAGARPGAADTAGFLRAPFTAVIRQFAEWLPTPSAWESYQMVQILILGFVVAIFVRAVLQQGPHSWERVGTALAVLTVVSISIWHHMVQYLRYPNDLVMIGLVMILAVPVASLPRWATPETLTKAIGALWISTAVVYIGI